MTKGRGPGYGEKMEILYLLIPLSLLFVALAVGVFFWAVKSGQFEDMEGPAYRILFDDESQHQADSDREQEAARMVDRSPETEDQR